MSQDIPTGAKTLSIVIPTYNEAGNIRPLVDLLDQVVDHSVAEYIFVDDNSPDGTSQAVRDLGREKPWVRVIERIGKRGLASACADGVMASAGDHVLVMDADLQHDEKIIPQMLASLTSGDFDVCSGTRFGNHEQVEGLTFVRKWVSYTANFLAKLVSGYRLKDPMSGFFMFKREDFIAALPKMAVSGYKVYFDFLCSSKKKLKVNEIKFDFRSRNDGESKLDMKVLWEYILLLGAKLTRGLLPVRFIGFALVGLSGVVFHLGVLFVLHQLLGNVYVVANTAATFLAMKWNYYWNNQLTYMHIRKRGLDYWKGLFMFVLISMLGASMSIAVATWLKESQGVWWPIATMVGIVQGAVWNYLVSRWLVWRRKY